ncbi:MAG: hypothetical protein L0Z70_08490, partial [Chloroflexi bacterium]|nr:hypothetical protein [Chloroflexota bacterium]
DAQGGGHFNDPQAGLPAEQLEDRLSAANLRHSDTSLLKSSTINNNHYSKLSFFVNINNGRNKLASFAALKSKNCLTAVF